MSETDESYTISGAMSNNKLFSLLVCAGPLLGMPAVDAGTLSEDFTLDQHWLESDGGLISDGWIIMEPEDRMIQVWTVGVEGLFQGVALDLIGGGETQGDYTVSIYSISDSFVPLRTAVQSTADLKTETDWGATLHGVRFDPIPMELGSQWIMEVYRSSLADLGWGTGDADLYTGGYSSVYERVFHFQTYTDPMPVPEPSTYAAIFGGLALLGAAWMRRKRV